MTKKIEVTLPFYKETKNTYHFQLPQGRKSEQPIHTLYVRTDQFDNPPSSIKVTVEVNK